MTKDAFLNGLRRGLGGLPADEVEEILADYAAHFAESAARGRSEAEVAAALGDPARIARELRADMGLRRLQARWSLSNLMAAIMALAGLAFVDVVFLMPFLILAAVLAIGLAIGLAAIGAVGLMIIATAFYLLPGSAYTEVLAALCIGTGLLSGFFGGGALLLIAISAGIRTLGHYARLHFRLVNQEPRPV